MQTKRYTRKNTSITISVFYENYQLNKYNMDPPYQRDMNIWSDKQKSFLIDTLFKNFPIPPIFLEQKIDSSTGKTNYDVIDGKQRLTTIAAFIEGTIKLPRTFGNDDYGLDILNNKTFNEIIDLSKSNPNVEVFISDFWAYTMSVEYIEKPDNKVVDNIFDRLNREGSRLNAAELRKSKYYDTNLYNLIFSFRQDILLKEILNKLDRTRLQDISFITEICILILENSIIDGVEKSIDEFFENNVDIISAEKSDSVAEKFRLINSTVSEFNLDYDKYSINGVSHLYAIFYLAYYMVHNQIDVTQELCDKLLGFYIDLRGDQTNENVKLYHASMQSASKYKYSRKKRVKALLSYLDIKFTEASL